MDNSINFKGTFLIKPTTNAIKRNLSPIQEVKSKLSPLLDGKKKQIIENVTSDGSVLYVAKNTFDKVIADALLDTKNVSFKYYPNLNIKSGIDEQKPVDAKSIIRAAARKAISTKQALETFFRQRPKKPVDIEKVQESNLKLLQKKLFINLDNPNYKKSIDFQNGICTIKTKLDSRIFNKKQVHTLVSITPPGKYGICYARVTPIQIEEPTRRLAIKNGEIIFEYTNPGSNAFIQNSNDAKQYYVESLNKYKKELEEYNKNK